MIEREKILSLYYIYKELLNDNEKEYFELYYYEDYSLNEIAVNKKVSKSYVGKIINVIIDKLNSYEDKLCILDRNNKIKNVIKDIDSNVKTKIEELL